MAKPTEELINKEKTEQAELEKRIAEKLASLSIEDLDELLKYEDDLVAERIAHEKKRREREEREKRRQEEKAQKQQK